MGNIIILNLHLDYFNRADPLLQDCIQHCREKLDEGHAADQRGGGEMI